MPAASAGVHGRLADRWGICCLSDQDSFPGFRVGIDEIFDEDFRGKAITPSAARARSISPDDEPFARRPLGDTPTMAIGSVSE
jgi:hypothetical protein